MYYKPFLKVTELVMGSSLLLLLFSLWGYNPLVGQATHPFADNLCTNQSIVGPNYIVLGIGVCVDAQHRRPLTFSCAGGPTKVPFAAPCPSYSAASCAAVCEDVKGCTGKRSYCVVACFCCCGEPLACSTEKHT